MPRSSSQSCRRHVRPPRRGRSRASRGRRRAPSGRRARSGWPRPAGRRTAPCRRAPCDGPGAGSARAPRRRPASCTTNHSGKRQAPMPVAGSPGIVRVGRRRVEPRRRRRPVIVWSLRASRGSTISLEVARLRPGVEAADDGRVPGQVDERAGSVGGDDLAAADLPVRLAAHAPSSTCIAAQVLQEQVHLGLHVAQRAVGAELPVVLGLEVLCRASRAAAAWAAVELVLLVLQVDAGGPVVLDDLAPGVEQVHDPVLHAAQALVALRLVRERLLRARARRKASSEPPLESRPDVSDPLDAPRRSQLGLRVAGEPHQRPGEAAVERARRERRDARHLDRAVEGLVVVPEALVVRAVARLVDVEERHDEPGPRRRRGRRGSWPGCTRRGSWAGRGRPSARAAGCRGRPRSCWWRWRSPRAACLVEASTRAAAAPRPPCRSTRARSAPRPPRRSCGPGRARRSRRCACAPP